MQAEKRSLLHIEIIRIFAAFFVIFNHTGNWGFALFLSYPENSLRYWLYLLISVICKISVPLFFMITGALLLKKEEEPFKKQAVRFLKILADLVIFSALFYLMSILRGDEVFSISRFFKVLIEKYWISAYWYLYAYLALLLTLPFLRRLANALKNIGFQYLIILMLIFQGVLPVVSYLFFSREFVLNPSFTITWLFSNVFFYPMIGFYLENRLDLKAVTGKRLAVLWAVNLVCIALTCILTAKASRIAGYHDQTYLMSLLPVNVIAVYVTLRKLLADHPVKGIPAKIIQTVGSCTFGIYLFHVFFLQLSGISLANLLYSHMESFPMTAELIRCLEIFLFSFLITWILKKIPLVKKLF